MKAADDYREGLHRRLKDPGYAARYLNASLDSADEGDFLFALREVAQVHGGLRLLAGKAGLNREHLFRMLSKGGNPELHSLRRIVGALGYKMTLERVP